MKDIYSELYRGLSQKEQTCCITGHRIIPPGEEQKVMTRTRYILRDLISQKRVRYFGLGGAVGYDMMVAEYLIWLKAHKHHQIKIISVLPWPGWRDTKDWTDNLRFREDRILKLCDKVVYVRPEYEKKIFLLRDRALVEGSGYCVSYCNRLRTGTAYTVKYALKRGLEVHNASSFDVKTLLKPARTAACRKRFPRPRRISPTTPSTQPAAAARRASPSQMKRKKNIVPKQ